MSETPPPLGLLDFIVFRIRAADTIFGQNVKLSLSMPTDEQWSMLPTPYLLVSPTTTRIEGTGRAVNGEIVLPRSVTLLAQISGHGTEADWAAASAAEIAELQLISILVGWEPRPVLKTKGGGTVPRRFLPTTFNGSRLAATRGPNVVWVLVFQFPEQLFIEPELDAETCALLAQPAVLDRICFEKAKPAPPPDPCESGPCDPCVPDSGWGPGGWLVDETTGAEKTIAAGNLGDWRAP